MAPTFTKSSASSTPIGRRTQRKRQKQSRRICEIQKDAVSWSKEEDADHHEQSGRRLSTLIKDTDCTTPWLRSQASDFEYQPKEYNKLREVEQQRREYLSPSPSSNPFSLFSVPTPPPTPPAYPALSKICSKDCGNSESCLPDEDDRTPNYLASTPKLPARKKLFLRASFQSEAASANAWCRFPESLVSSSKTTTISLPSLLDDSFHVAQFADSSSQSTHQEPMPFRIPSPLLYHRRSRSTYTDPLYEPAAVQCARPCRTQKSKNASPRPVFHAIGEQNDPASCTIAQMQVFVAAKLPLMNGQLTTEESDDGGVTLRRNRLGKSTVPVKTPTSVYVFPRNYHNLMPCSSLPIWDTSLSGGVNPTGPPDHCLQFPKLDFFRLPTQAGITSNRHPTQTDLPYQPGELDSEVAVAGNDDQDTALPILPDARDRSSTKDSLDTSFNVATATLQDHFEDSHYSSDHEMAIDNSALTILGASDDYVGSSGGSQLRLSATVETRKTHESGRTPQTAGSIHVSSDETDKTRDRVLEQYIGITNVDKGNKKERSVASSDATPVYLYLSLANTVEGESMSSTTVGYTLDNSESEVEVGVDDAVLETDSWLWEDEQWESTSTSSVGDVNELL